MALSQVEFALLASVLAAYLIFTPEPLVLLRNLLVWASLTWAAWHGYEHWHTKPWLRNLVGGFSTGYTLSSIVEIFRDLTSGPRASSRSEATADSRLEHSWVGWLASNWLGYVLGRQPSQATTSGTLLYSEGLSISQPNPRTTGTVAKASPEFISCPGKYYVILVTTPTDQVYGPLSDHLFVGTDQPQQIPWNSTSIDGIPSMLECLAFRRGFALCLVPVDVWRSTRKTLAEKLEGQKFWDYYGGMDGTMAVSWTPDQIDRINAIQQVGIANSEGDAIAACTGYYLQLRRNWNYFPIWWNDADFAIILASLLVNDKEMSLCSALIRRRDELRQTEVIEPRRRACQNSSTAANGAGMALEFAGPLAAPAVFTSMFLGVGSQIVSQALKAGENSRQSRRQAACEELQDTFPRLRELFEKVT